MRRFLGLCAAALLLAVGVTVGPGAEPADAYLAGSAYDICNYVKPPNRWVHRATNFYAWGSWHVGCEWRHRLYPPVCWIINRTTLSELYIVCPTPP